MGAPERRVCRCCTPVAVAIALRCHAAQRCWHGCRLSAPGQQQPAPPAYRRTTPLYQQLPLLTAIPLLPNRSWLSNFAEAADAVGIPVCMSVAVVDMATDEATQTRDFHAKTERKSSSSGKSSPAGKSSTGGSKAGTSGSQAGTDSSKAGTDSSKASTGGR